MVIINRKYFIFFILFIISSIGFSQKILKGVVKNEYDIDISNALIQVYDENFIKLLEYCFSNSDGNFEISLPENKSVNLKVSALNYSDYNYFLNLNNYNKNLIIILNKKIIDLDEVTIFSNEKSVIMSNDSISYNLNTIRDGTENNLGDLIKKLPGLELSSDGKVKFQGSSIDKIFIDGNEFFGNKHQIATDNINSDIIEGIDLLLNHNDDINLKDFEENNKIVLNIKLDNKKKRRIIGNIESNAGILKKHYSHLNIFNFFKNGNVSLISDFNNIGQMPLSVTDFIDLIGGTDNISNFDSGLTDISEMIPEYIYNEDKFKEKENLFTAFNLTFKKKKININSNFF